MIRLPIFVLYWAGFAAIKIPTALLGLVMVPLLWRYRQRPYTSLPGWTRPWSNPEDWFGQRTANKLEYNSLPWWWADSRGTGFWSFVKYHAVRNPANGLRSFEALDVDIDPSKVRYKATTYLDSYEPRRLKAAGLKSAGYIAWQGFKAGIQYLRIWNDERYLVIKFGWRVHPSDRENPSQRDPVLAADSGFASKFLFYRKWSP